MAPEARYRFVHGFPFWRMAEPGRRHMLDEILAVAEAHNDPHTAVAALFYLYFSMDSSPAVMEKMRKKAVQQGYVVEQVVAEHYLHNSLDPRHARPYEQAYVSVQKTFEQMQEIGMVHFRDYNPDAILEHLSRFMWELGDYDKAFVYLTGAERLIHATEEGLHVYTQVLSYLQTYWKQHGAWDKSLVYARQLLATHAQFTSQDPTIRWNNRFWQGMASLEVASLLMEQGKLAESEHYANQGYALSRAPDTATSFVIPFQAEFDALLVLIPVKLKMGKVKDAGTLLQRALYLQQALEPLGEMSYFKPLRLYHYLSQYHERCGDAVQALHYTRLSTRLKDSLDTRNDTHRLAQAQRRLDAERYVKKIELVENEKQIQQLVQDTIILILILAIILVYINFRNMKFRKLQKEKELLMLRGELDYLTDSFRKKLELINNLREEKEWLKSQETHNAYLEQLINGIILTEDDWVRFRTLFEKVHPGFLALQKELYPGITPAEIRLLALDKLGLTVPEIAHMLGVNKNTVYQTRVRLRRRTGEDG